MVRGPGSVAGVVCCLLRALQCMSELVIICALLSLCAFPVVALGQDGWEVCGGGGEIWWATRVPHPHPRALAAAAAAAAATHDHGRTWALVLRLASGAAQWAGWRVRAG